MGTHFYRPSTEDPTRCHWCNRTEAGVYHRVIPRYWKTALKLVAFTEGQPRAFRPYDLRRATAITMTPIVKADNVMRGLAKAGLVERTSAPQPRARGVPRGPKPMYWRLTPDGLAWLRDMPRTARWAVVEALRQGSLHG
jgi:hypothetical protein